MVHVTVPHAPDPCEPTGPVPPGVPGSRVVLGCALLFLATLGLSVGLAVVLPAQHARAAARLRAACANRLRGIALAAAQYADDHGLFPHARGPDELDGDPSTADTPRAFRALFLGGYLSDPETLVCPAATARPRTSAEVRAAQRRWLTEPAGSAGPSPTLEGCEAISYGWTRRALGRNAPPRTPLAADKAVLARGGPEPRMRGNHPDGWNLARVDASVEWLSLDSEPFPGAWLSATSDPERDGFLSVAPQRDRDALR
ncbi:MAG: DUF1559 domain-containing protein [Planctomycetota bacterium]|nr:MAG: DUF1559 domain-containing protein [Planctomycetota bacterium]